MRYIVTISLSVKAGNKDDAKVEAIDMINAGLFGLENIKVEPEETK